MPEKNHKTWKSFLGMYAGEHAAGTEFMIGPLFLTVGVSAFDLIVGLFFGNLFAVLSWRYLTAKIAVKERFTLYFKLEKISGKKLVKFYNVANGILFCFLAGAMITVSATAVGVPTNMKMPTLSDVLPNSYTWILIVLIIGMITTLIASNGYSIVSKVSNWMSPVIIFAFFGCGLVSASQLGITSMSDLLNIWGSGSEPFPGQIKYSFWHVFSGHGLQMQQCTLECLIFQFSDMLNPLLLVGQLQLECILGTTWLGLQLVFCTQFT